MMIVFIFIYTWIIKLVSNSIKVTNKSFENIENILC